MADIAEQGKLAELSPYKEQLEMSRKSVLATAEMAEHEKGTQVPTAELEKYYEAHKDAFTTAYVTVVQVPIKNEAESAAAKAKAETLRKQAQGGRRLRGDGEAVSRRWRFQIFQEGGPGSRGDQGRRFPIETGRADATDRARERSVS